MVKKLFVLCICCLITLCSCDTGNASNTPTPKPIPQVVLGSSLKDFQIHFANEYDFEQGVGGVDVNHTNIFDVDSPDYELCIDNGKIDCVSVQVNAYNNGSACSAFIPKDKKLITDSPSDDPIHSSTAIYESKWLAKQFPASVFVDDTNDSSSGQLLTKPGTFTLIWGYADDYNSYCTISVGKNVE